MGAPLGRRSLCALALCSLTLAGCDGPQETYSARRAQVLSELGPRVGSPVLDDLVAAAEAYARACEGEPGPEARRQAQDGWRDLRVAWRRAAPWLIADAAEGLYEERLDAAPDVARLDAVRAGGPAPDAEAVSAMGWPLKSLRAQGDLLFGPGELSARAWSLLQHASRQWAAEAATLAALWSAPEGLGHALAHPESTPAFRDAKDAVDMLLRRLVTVVARLRDDDVAALAGGTRKGLPARFEDDFDRAGHHREELIATLDGVATLYLGAGEARGLGALVAKKSARVDASFRAALEDARREAAALPADAVRATRADPALGRPLYDYVTLLRAQLTTSVASQLDTSLGFTLADGD